MYSIMSRFGEMLRERRGVVSGGGGQVREHGVALARESFSAEIRA